jgi:hypothetical protein
MLADKNAWCVVFDAFSDDDLATDVKDVEDAVNGIAGSCVGQFFFSPAQPRDGLKRRVFGGTDKFKFDQALEI